MSGSNSAERKRHEPLVLVETADLSEEEWLDYRRRGIGGSDVSAIFGTSPFRTARDLYYDKLNIASVEDDEGNWVAMEMGHLLEPLVAKIFERKTGYRVYQIKKMFQHPQYPWMLADVDYFVELPDGTTAILENKTTNYNARDNWWMNGKETVPVYYESQGRHYMAVTDLDRCFFCCLYGNNEEEVIIREVKRDFEYEAEMVFLEQYFWENHVQRHVPPPYTESGALIIESARKHFGPADKNAPAVALDLDMTAKLMQYLRLLDEKKNAEVYSKEIDKDIQRLKALLIAEMGTSCTAVCEQEGVNYTVMLALYARLNNTTTSDAYWEIGEALCNDFHRERPNSGYEMAGNQQAGTGSPVSGTQTDLAGYERRGELKTVQQAERASGQEIHQTLSLLLAMLPLQPAHRNHLHSPKRGLSDEQIDRIGFKSTPPPFLCRSITERLMKQGCKVEGVPGFYLDDSGRWTMNFYRKNAGILIPAVGYDGMIHGLQILLDSPLKQKDDPPDKSGAKYIWFSSSSKNMGVTSGSPVHFIGNPSARVVYVIEGLLKADISHCLTNRTFAAIAGANNTSQLDTLFALLAQNGTEEIIEAHDMDKYSNQMTSNGASKIYLMARKNGMACRQLTWNPNYKGFDDWQLALREKEQKEKEVQRMNFKQQYLCGKCDFTYIDGCVELWHTRAEKDLDLTEYLGLTKEEYQIFLAQGNRALKDILDSQRVFRRFCIYQLCLSETQTVPFAFKRLDALHKAGYEQPPAAAYQTVWSAEVCCPKGQNDMEVLGRLFLDFNEHLPEDYRGRPLAPSDVVELDCQGKRTYFYVNHCRDFAPVRFSPFLCKRLPEPAQKQE